jgi:cytochrome c-type biogenesis protein
LLRWRGGMLAGGNVIKQALGLFLVVIGLLVVTGLDRSLEAGFVEASPQWLTNITTRF